MVNGVREGYKVGGGIQTWQKVRVQLNGFND